MGGDDVAWLEGLSPWPTDGFGVERMHALLAELGHPETGLPVVHVVGTNGKSTTTRMVEALLLSGGRRAGAFLSPHIRSWAERIRVEGEEADLPAALAAVRPAAERVGATQFEVTRGVTRPVWEPDAKGMALFAHARKIANSIGYDINPQSSGGGSDGNFTGAMGVTTLDGLGVQGAMAHTLEEHVLVDSLVPRARLMAGLLTTLD